MRIKAEFTEKGASITCAIAIPELGISPKPVNFLLDTGASNTMLSEIEAIKLDIDYLNLKKSPKPIVSMGGASESYILNNVIFILTTETRSQDFDMESILISRLPKRSGKKRGKKDKFYLKSIPSLIGRDFFSKYNMKLVVDFGTKEAFLEY